MTNQKSTKRALLTSVLALLVCVTMLIGSTFAWFTDTVNSGRNKINSGNLDIVLELGTLKADAEKATTGVYAGYYDADDYDWTEVTSTTEIFSDADLFEPGYMKTAVFRVRNAGTLALNYKLSANVYKETEGTNVHGDTFKLSDVLDVAFVKGVVDLGSRTTAWVYMNMGASVGAVTGKLADTVAEGSFNAKDDMMYYTMLIGMKDTVGNEANYMTGTAVPTIEFGINLVATQRSHEKDSYGKDYDANAKYPELPAADVTKLDAAQIATIGAIDIINDAGGETYTLDTGYAFKTEDTAENIESNPYKYWNVDYVISFDKAVPANSVALAGAYESFANGAWLAFTNPMAIAANEELRLLESAVDFTSFASNPIFVNYGEIVSNVGEFQCGATDINNALAGTTITVELRMYETAPADKNADNSHNNETGAYQVIDTVTYTF